MTDAYAWYSHSAIDLPYSLSISPLILTFSPQVGEGTKFPLPLEGEGWGEVFQTMKCHLDEFKLQVLHFLEISI
ncbi:MAG: hypothetical protein COB41_08495 [Proteobacteria bacterium]|nr:MAG: hypothetical protein COB41_08495 [Pseudomonadota bacterium]